MENSTQVATRNQQGVATASDKEHLKPMTIKNLFNKDEVKHKFQELLGKRAPAFITSVLQIAAQNDQLAKCDPVSVYQCAAVAATLDLPLNPNLGFAYIIGYKSKQKDGTWKDVAQFQIGYKGFIQLAQRSGQFKTIAAAPIYEGQLVEQNPLTGFQFDFSKKTSENIIGYAAHFSLLNGFEKTLYMTTEELKKHGGKFSQTFKKGFGLWKDDFDSMALKTVIKLLLSKFAPLSVDMQRAVITDQALVKDADTIDVEYVDNENVPTDPLIASKTKENERVENYIRSATSVNQLDEIQDKVSEDQLDLFNERKQQLSAVK